MGPILRQGDMGIRDVWALNIRLTLGSQRAGRISLLYNEDLRYGHAFGGLAVVFI